MQSKKQIKTLESAKQSEATSSNTKQCKQYNAMQSKAMQTKAMQSDAKQTNTSP